MKKLLVILMVLCSMNTFAIDIKVLFVKGSATIETLDEKSRPAKAGDLIVEGDKIETHDSSLVIIKIKGHSVHRIEENTTLLVEQLPYKYEDSKDIEQHCSFFLEVGTIFTEVVEKSDSDTMEIRTRSSVMGVRGTKFMVSQDKDSEYVWLSVDHGEVHIKNDHMGKADSVGAKQTIVVENDKKFSAQKRYKFHKNLEWNLNSKEVRKTFKANRINAKLEFRKKKSKWVRNEVRWSKVSANWAARKEKFKSRNKNKKKNVKLKKRLKNIKEKLKKGKENFKNKKLKKNFKKSFLKRPGMTGKPNNFLNRKLDKKRRVNPDKMKKRRKNIKKRIQQRRQRPAN